MTTFSTYAYTIVFLLSVKPQTPPVRQPTPKCWSPKKSGVVRSPEVTGTPLSVKFRENAILGVKTTLGHRFRGQFWKNLILEAIFKNAQNSTRPIWPQDGFFEKSQKSGIGVSGGGKHVFDSS